MKKNNTRKNKPSRLPLFRSLDQLVEFFDTRDLGDYWDQLPEAQFEVDIHRNVHLVAIDAKLAARVSQLARSRKISSQELVESILEQVLAK